MISSFVTISLINEVFMLGISVVCERVRTLDLSTELILVLHML